MYTDGIHQLPQSLYNHSKHGSVLFDNRLFLIAGFKEKRVESFNFSTSKWEAAPSLYKDRYDFAVAVHKDKIFVAGGCRGLNDSYTNNIEIFHNNKWKVADFDIGIKVRRFSLWPRKSGKYVLFGGQFSHGEMNNTVYHLNLDKENCHKKEDLPKIEGCYADRYHGSKSKHCFIMKNENVVAQYDSEDRVVKELNQS